MQKLRHIVLRILIASLFLKTEGFGVLKFNLVKPKTILHCFIG